MRTRSLRAKAKDVRDAGIAVRYMELLLERKSIKQTDVRAIEKYWTIVSQCRNS